VRFIVWFDLEIDEAPQFQEGVDSHDRANISCQMPPASFRNNWVRNIKTHLLM